MVRVKMLGEELEQELIRHNNEQEMVELHKALSRLLMDIKGGNFKEYEFKKFPGTYLWNVSGMSWPTKIANLYGELKVELTGGESDIRKSFLLKIKK